MPTVAFTPRRGGVGRLCPYSSNLPLHQRTTTGRRLRPGPLTVRRVGVAARDQTVTVDTLQFFVPKLDLGGRQIVKVVGSPKELGSWDPSHAPSMRSPGDGRAWELEVSLPREPFEFKLVLTDLDSDDRALWESGGNRAVQVQEAISGHKIRLLCLFGDPSKTELSQWPMPPAEVTTQDDSSSAENHDTSHAVHPVAAPHEETASGQHQTARSKSPTDRHVSLPFIKAFVMPAPEDELPDGVDVIWKTEGGGKLIVMAYEE